MAFFSCNHRAPNRLSTWVAPLLLVALLVLVPGALPSSSLATHPASAGAGNPVLPALRVTHSVTPSVSSPSPFYNVSFVPTDSFAPPCNSYGYCYNQSQSPSLLSLANGEMGASFSIVTTQTLSTCSNAPTNTTVQVAFSTSSDGGQSWAVPSLISDRGSASCPYDQSFEPSFAMGGSQVFGTYVMANASMLDMMGGTYGDVAVVPYVDRIHDALAFVNSTDNGTTFSTPKAIVTDSNISRPALAAFGNSVYIVYENISNGTTPIVGGSLPISLRLVYSTDAGTTWHGPYTLPVEGGGDPGQLNTAMGPSIAVNATGTVAIAYADNRSCIAFCFSSAQYGLNIVVITSTTNGTSWKGPVRVASGVGEASSNNAYALFEEAPGTSIAFGPGGKSVYVAYSGSVNLSLSGGPYAFVYPSEDYSRPTVFTAASSNLGVTWTRPEMVPPPLHSADGYQNLFGEANINPAIAVSPGGTVFLTYSYFTWENYACGMLAFAPNALTHTTDQFIVTSPDGVGWSTPSLAASSYGSQGIDFLADLGFTSAIGFTGSGVPVTAYALPVSFLTYVSGSFYAEVNIAVSTPYLGATTNVTFVENGLVSGTAWTGEIQGVGLNTTASSFTVSGVPTGRSLFVYWPFGFIKPGVTGTYVMPVVSDGPTVTLSGPLTVYFNFTTYYPVNLAADPADIPYIDFTWGSFGGNASFTYNFGWSTSVYSGTVYGPQYNGCPMPLYFPKGMVLAIGSSSGTLSFGTFGSGAIDYWTGYGPGNYTGPGPYANVTVNGPINETFWLAGGGTYTEQFRAPSLNSSSTFGFSVDGAPYSGPGGGSVGVPGLATGPHWITNISATSSQTGWRYFGWSDTGSPVILPEEPVVNLSFSYVDLSAALGTVSFHAPSVPWGTTWHLSVNGTDYSSNTPWINVTTRPGTYPVLSYPVVSSDSAVILAPTTPSTLESVTTGSTYLVNYTSAYRLDVLASAGGKVSVAGGSKVYYPVNSTVQFNATPLSGFTWGGWTGAGPGSYTGMNTTVDLTLTGSVQEVASFYPMVPNRFNLTLDESGIPNGTLWSVYLNGVGYASTNSTLVVHNVYSAAVSGNLGRYTLLVPYAYGNASSAGIRYAPNSYSATVNGGTTYGLQFAPQYHLSVAASVGGVVGVSSQWVTGGQSVQLSAQAATGYVFDHWQGSGPGNYTGTLESVPVTPAGPVTETAIFVPVTLAAPTRYTESFHPSTTFAAGTPWTVVFNGTPYTAEGPYLNISGLLSGTYALSVPNAISPDGKSLYIPSNPPPHLTILSNGSQILLFSTSYFVEIEAVGQGIVTPSSGWHVSGSSVTINATPSGSAAFVGWSGSGPGNYSGTNPQTAIRVEGPITEVASFAAPSPSSVTTTTTNSFWNSPTLWVGLGVVGVAAGALIGLVLGRRGRGGSAASPPPGAADATEEGHP